MSGRIAILTPDAASDGYRTRWREVWERNAAPLRAVGFCVEGRDWTKAADLDRFGLVLPLLVWGYPFAPRQWAEAVDRWEKRRAPSESPSVLRWNADKAYLGG